MSYSYVKTVFPNFEYSNVYNDKLYNDMNGPVPVPAPAPATIAAPAQVAAPVQPAPLPAEESISYLKNEPLIVRPGNQVKLLETTTYKEPFSQDKDNLHFYNKRIEGFRGNEDHDEQGRISGHVDHQEYIKHLAKCEFCRSMIKRQYTNEQMMELISYITLGIFILILLDTIKK
jgi:hypothetical protein